MTAACRTVSGSAPSSLAGLVRSRRSALCDKDKLKGPDAEVSKTDVKLDLPAVPAFDLPAGACRWLALGQGAAGQGQEAARYRGHGPRLRDLGVRLQDGDSQAGRDRQGRADSASTRIRRCASAPKFYIGDTAETPAEKSLWVVDVPRPYNTLEVKRIKKKDRIEPGSLRAGREGQDEEHLPAVRGR